jgi:hypothetical protein
VQVEEEARVAKRVRRTAPPVVVGLDWWGQSCATAVVAIQGKRVIGVEYLGPRERRCIACDEKPRVGVLFCSACAELLRKTPGLVVVWAAARARECERDRASRIVRGMLAGIKAGYESSALAYAEEAARKWLRRKRS